MLKMFKGVSAKGGTNGSLTFGVSSTIGRRPYDEDRHTCILDYAAGGVDMSYFGVYDGHGGDKASEYCVEGIPARLKSRLSNEGLSSKDVVKGFTRAFENTDKDFSVIAYRHLLDDGTTAVATLFRDGKIFCANAGDSRAILSRNSIAVNLSDDPKPNRADERSRIVKLGGFVKHLGVWRTQGVLAVSRAIGDVSLKPYVIATPEVKVVTIEPGDEFVVIASDGLWDVMTSQEVVDMLHSRSQLLEQPEMAARALVTESYRRSSYDNITAMVITLPEFSSNRARSSGSM